MTTTPTPTRPQDPGKETFHPRPPAYGGRPHANRTLAVGDLCKFRSRGATRTGVVMCVIPHGHDVRRTLARAFGDSVLKTMFRRSRRDAVVRGEVSYVVATPDGDAWLYPRKVEPA